MSGHELQFELLGRHHDRAAFSCGVEALDRYLQRQARQDMARNVTAVFVLHDPAERAIVGYYTLSATAFYLSNLAPNLARRLPRYASLPAVQLGRLAVDQRYRGQGFGRLLLTNALERALTNSVQIAALAVVVDAKDDAAISFYKLFGFSQFNDQPNSLYLLMWEIAALLDDDSSG